MRKLSIWMLFVGALVFLPDDVRATPPGANGKLLFTRAGALYTVNADGTGETALAPGTGTRNDPAWSPDGTRIAFERGSELWVMHADGTGETKITTTGKVAQPTWSPDGSEIGFRSGAGTPIYSDEIRAVPVAGGPDRLVADLLPGGCCQDIEDPDWSPNGEEIAFVVVYSGPSWVIYVAAADGSGFVDISYSSEADMTALSWAPAGSHFALFSGGDRNVWIADRFDPDFGERLTEDPAIDTNPAWSPDGSRMAFQSQRGDPANADDLFVMNADGSSETRITNTPRVSENLEGWQSIPIDSYARPKGATPLYASLVPAYSPCTTSNRTHGAPLAFGACAPPQPTSTDLTIGTGDANGAPTKSISYARFDVQPGAPADPGDQADVLIASRITDVRRAGDLSDYPGELRASNALQVTDKDSTPTAPGTQGAATGVATGFGYTIPCAPTGDATIGSECRIVTSADGLVPGMVKELRRSIWQLGRVEVYDGGPDEDGDTEAGNTLFMAQGVFVP
jgi:WD40-like Beta Propeller Repeat/Dipeptidyl peptidase IV (DPP IV) N-terminal region